jgi:dTDP-4-dehydrorhamnose 3,5-epimerase
VSRFDIVDLPLKGLKLVQRQVLGDSRGFLSRLFCSEELGQIGWNKPLVQINHTYTASKGTVRGLHYQYPPHAEAKLVTCIRGKVWDVAVDLRSDSSTFLHWRAEIISAENGKALLIPEGFAHGFQSLTDNVELIYFHTAAYEPQAEAGLSPRDPRLAIKWPLDIGELSARDAAHPMLDEGNEGFVGLVL